MRKTARHLPLKNKLINPINWFWHISPFIQQRILCRMENQIEMYLSIQHDINASVCVHTTLNQIAIQIFMNIRSLGFQNSWINTAKKTTTTKNNKIINIKILKHFDMQTEIKPTNCNNVLMRSIAV